MRLSNVTLMKTWYIHNGTILIYRFRNSDKRGCIICRDFTDVISWWSVILFLNQWFSTEAILSPMGHVAMSGSIFSCHNLGEWCYWHLVRRGQTSGLEDSANHPARPGRGSHSKESPSPKCLSVVPRFTKIVLNPEPCRKNLVYGDWSLCFHNFS